MYEERVHTPASGCSIGSGKVSLGESAKTGGAGRDEFTAALMSRLATYQGATFDDAPSAEQTTLWASEKVMEWKARLGDLLGLGTGGTQGEDNNPGYGFDSDRKDGEEWGGRELPGGGAALDGWDSGPELPETGDAVGVPRSGGKETTNDRQSPELLDSWSGNGYESGRSSPGKRKWALDWDICGGRGGSKMTKRS